MLYMLLRPGPYVLKLSLKAEKIKKSAIYDNSNIHLNKTDWYGDGAFLKVTDQSHQRTHNKQQT